MLIERITNIEMRYRLLGENPRAAFLQVIAGHNAMEFDKVRALADIVERRPEILKSIFDTDLFYAFGNLAARSRAKGELLSYVEMDWVVKYVKGRTTQWAIEEILFTGFLTASDHWDKARREFKWTLSQNIQRSLVATVLERTDVGSKRKVQLAQEFGLPQERYLRDYFKKLLWDRHYDKAAELKFDDIETAVVEVIVDDLDAGYVRDATDIVKLFLPRSRQDIVKEIEEIKQKLSH
jgi:hypothetical protein